MRIVAQRPMGLTEVYGPRVVCLCRVGAAALGSEKGGQDGVLDSSPQRWASAKSEEGDGDMRQRGVRPSTPITGLGDAAPCGTPVATHASLLTF